MDNQPEEFEPRDSSEQTEDTPPTEAPADAEAAANPSAAEPPAPPEESAVPEAAELTAPADNPAPDAPDPDAAAVPDDEVGDRPDAEPTTTDELAAEPDEVEPDTTAESTAETTEATETAEVDPASEQPVEPAAAATPPPAPDADDQALDDTEPADTEPADAPDPGAPADPAADEAMEPTTEAEAEATTDGLFASIAPHQAARGLEEADTPAAAEAGRRFADDAPSDAAASQVPARRASRGRRIGNVITALIFVVSIAMLFAAWRIYERGSRIEDNTGLTAPVYTPGQGDGASGTAGVGPAWCNPNPESFVANKITFYNDQKEYELLSLGLDSNGAAAAPPAGSYDKFAWFNKGPMVGSDKGNVVLTVHRLIGGGAPGNDLNDGMLTEGDIIVLSNDTGESACYRYTNSIKVVVDDYDPDSKILYDNDGKPQLAIITCTDWNSAEARSMSRMIYYAELVHGAEQ